MKRKILSIFLTLVLVLSFSLVMAVPVAAATTTFAGDTIGVTSLAEPYLIQDAEAFNAEPHTTVVDDVAFDAQTGPVIIEGAVSALDLGVGWMDTAYVEIGLRPEATMNDRNAGVYLIAFNTVAGETQIHLQDYTGSKPDVQINLPGQNTVFSYKITLEPSGDAGGTATLEVVAGETTYSGAEPVPYGQKSTWDENVPALGGVVEDFSNARLFYSIIAECRGAASIPYSATVGDITIDDTLYVGDEGQEFNTIQDAINAALPGHIINVAAGIYNECLNVNQSVSIVGVGVSQVTINESGTGFTNSCIYVSADNVLLQGFTLVGNPNTSPDYGIKFGDVSGGSVQHVLVEYARRTGFDFLGTKNTTVSNIESRDNVGHGVQLCDCTDIALSDITIGVNGWEGVNVATWGKSTTPLGTSGIVFSGTNSFGDVFQIEEGDYNHPNVAPAGAAIITYSTNPADNADVTVLASDFGYAIHGDQDDGPGGIPPANQNRVWFFETLAEAQAKASLASFGHFNGNGVYVESLTDRTQLYISPGCEIQAAIDAATPAGGDTITVEPGTYNEAVQINKALTLQGANADANPVTEIRGDESIINAGGAARAVNILSNLGVVTFKGFTVQNFANQGICHRFDQREGTTVHVLNNIVLAFPVSPEHGNSIQVSGDYSTVIGNDVTGASLQDPNWAGTAILVVAADNAVVRGNFVHDAEKGIGVVGYTDWGGPAINTLIELNTVQDSRYGITVDCDSQNTVIRYNDVLNNGLGQPDGSGIESQSYWGFTPSGTEIHFNNIDGNLPYGVVSYEWVDGAPVIASSNSEEVDATNNWWGHASGPADAAKNLATGYEAYGDAVSTNVDYEPWLLEKDSTTYYDKTLALKDGWTLISTDKLVATTGSTWIGTEGLGAEKTVLAYEYTGAAYPQVDLPDGLQPIDALYVKTAGGGGVGINYSASAPGESSKELVAGWNLISSGTIADAGAVLSPLRDIATEGTGLTTLVSQGSYNQYTAGWYVDATDWTKVTDNMSPFDGYWIYMNADKSFGVISD